MLIPGVNRDLEGSLMLYTERTTPCVSTPDSRPLGEHQPHMRSPRFIGSTRVQCTKDCAVNCKRPTHSNRSSHWHDDALTHANNHAIYNFIGGHQLDRWPVNQSLASMSKQQQFRSAGKPPNKQSATPPPPLTKKRKREKKIPARGCLSPHWLCAKVPETLFIYVWILSKAKNLTVHLMYLIVLKHNWQGLVVIISQNFLNITK